MVQTDLVNYTVLKLCHPSSSRIRFTVWHVWKRVSQAFNKKVTSAQSYNETMEYNVNNL